MLTERNRRKHECCDFMLWKSLSSGAGHCPEKRGLFSIQFGSCVIHRRMENISRFQCMRLQPRKKRRRIVDNVAERLNQHRVI
ncbi:hypothetical protein X942_4723 [Burkholderia pseudomallei MSHR5596]|nr:hypothetical protein X942_4723 [Burkholderia pseudomallei MSHR5596]